MSVANQKYGASGIWWRVAATAGLLSLCVLTTVRHASGAFEAAGIPVASLTAQNGMITGTTRMMGDHFLLYNGTRLESMAQSMEVNFERGGSMVLCPRSQLQILTARGSDGIMLAFQTGGSQQPFPLRMGDEVLTPDWRVELGDAHQGDMGVVQIVTNRHGDLCLQGNAQTGAYFRVTPLFADGSFRVASGQSQRFSNGKTESSTEACGCDAAFAPPGNAASANVSASTAPLRQETALGVPAASIASIAAQPAGPAQVIGGSESSTTQTPAADANALSSKRKKREHPHDVVSYVGSFVHRLFGR